MSSNPLAAFNQQSANFASQAIQSQMNAKAPQAVNLAGGYQDILKQFTTAQNAANQANQQRYQDILKLYSGLGQSRATEIANQGAQQQASATQGLTSRGLGNTTVTSAVSRGINTDTSNQQTALQEQIAQLQGGVMERVNQQGPDLGMYSNLLQQMMSGNQGRRTMFNPGNPNAPAYGPNDLYNSLTGGSAGASAYRPNQSQATVSQAPGSAYGNQLAKNPFGDWTDEDWDQYLNS
jgi:hypothetical protein